MGEGQELMQSLFWKSHTVMVAGGLEGRWVWRGLTGFGCPSQHCSLTPTAFPGTQPAVPGV